MHNFIEVNSLNKVFQNPNGNIQALKNININFPKTGMFSIVGKSGCGKSTLLNILGGLHTEYDGSITIDGVLLSKLVNENQSNLYKNKIDFLFQSNNLIPKMSSLDNILLGLPSAFKDIDKINHLFNQFDLPAQCIHQKTEEMSGGQVSRVALVRTILRDSDIILADEPTGNLDKENASELMRCLSIASQSRLVIVVTHDIDLAQRFSNSIIFLNYGIIEKIQELKPVEILETVEKTKSEVLIFDSKKDIKLGLFYFKRNLKQGILSLLLMVVSLFCILSLSYLFRFDQNEAINQYLETHYYPYLLVQQAIESEDLSGVGNPIYLTNGQSLVTLLENKHFDLMRLIMYDQVSAYDMDSPLGESESIQTNLVIYHDISMTVTGEIPVDETEVVISSELYYALFPQIEIVFPQILYTRFGSKTVVGIIDTSQSSLVSSDFYDMYYKYVVFSIDSSLTSTNFFSTDEEDSMIVFHANQTSELISGTDPLNANEVVISLQLSTSSGLTIGDTFLFSSQSNFGKFDLNNYYPNGVTIVGISNSMEISMIHENGIFEDILSDYNQYFNFDYLLIQTPQSFEASALYPETQILEPGIFEIETQSSFINKVNNLMIPILFIMCALIFLSSYIMVFGLIDKRNREIGILRLMSAGIKDILIILNVQILLLYFISVAISLGTSYIWIQFLNKSINLNLDNGFIFFKFDAFLFLLITLSTAIIMLLSAVTFARRKLKHNIFQNISS
ncbi:MAG: ATP-binding cassette domain-containing protein [Firmicutes bacterium]|nr:ATP-binding cassette domain-containing protein [Bacillota bacterium]